MRLITFAFRKDRTPMAMQRAYQWYTFEQYHEIEEQYPDRKFELVEGQIREMAGGTFEHSKIAVNLTIHIGIHLRRQVCQIVNSDLHVHPLGRKDPSYLP